MEKQDRRILIVDDDKGTREFYSQLFEDAGYAAVALENPALVFSTAGEFKPDLLLLDWDMPYGGGKQAYDTACIVLGRKLPVIFASGFPEQITFQPQPGLVVIIRKPANMETLLAEAQKLLAGS